MHLLVWWCVLVTASASFTGCGGYVSIPKNTISPKPDQLKVQLFTEGSSKPLTETEIAPKSGFFHVSHDRPGRVQIRLIHPEGWSFDKTVVAVIVDGETDICSINQDIIFNFLGIQYSGAILSKGGELGPQGVMVRLQTSSGEIHQTETTADGLFRLDAPVMPSQAVLSATHPSYSISEPVTLSLAGEATLVGLPIVTGYQVMGAVYENSLPVARVLIDLADDNGKVLDSQFSDETGSFVFAKVPAGEYEFRATYEKDGSVFTIDPPSQRLTVSNSNNKLSTNFAITGLSSSGKIVTNTGLPLKGAEIVLDGEKLATTGVDGVFVLKRVKPGIHEVTAIMDDYIFSVVNVDVNSKSPNIPDLMPEKVSLCASVDVTNARLELTSPSGSLRQHSNKNEHCFMVPSGSYTIRPLSSNKIQFNPATIQVDITDTPVKDIKFARFTRSFEAFVECLGPCQTFSASIINSEGIVTPLILGKVEKNVNRRSIQHPALDPGKYTVEVANEKWCFDENNHSKSVEVVIPPDGQHPNPPFIISQKAFRLQLKSDIMTEVEIFADDRSVVEKLQPGYNNFCIAAGGEYIITPRGCHNFAQATIRYNTAASSVISITPVSHKLPVEIVISESQVKDAQVTLMVNGNIVTGGEFSAGRLRYSINVKADKVTVEPKSPTKYIHPTKYTGFATFEADGCASAIVFDALDALFIRGRVDPAVAGVDITLTSSEGAITKKFTTTTTGAYSFGPLNPHLNYKVFPEHQTYRFLPEADDEFSFKALQLANLVVNLVGLNGDALKDVTIKLSGPERYRKIAKIDEKSTFERLEPGDYFVIFEKKEYSFEPNKFELTLTADKTLDIAGTRFQFSAFGRLASPSQAAFPDYRVEASSPDCDDHVEEAVTDVDGQFRIFGLKQRCSYSVKVQTLGNYVVSPESIQLYVNGEDTRNIEFQAFKTISQIRVSGNVLVCPTCPLKSIKAELFFLDLKHTRIKPAVETIYMSEDSGTFFNFKPIEDSSQVVEIVLTGPDDSSSQIVYPNAPLKHVSFRYTHAETDSKSIQAQGQNKLGPVLVLVALLLSTIFLNREKLSCFVDASSATTKPSSPTRKTQSLGNRKSRSRM